jgi:hypothetical protein
MLAFIRDGVDICSVSAIDINHRPLNVSLSNILFSLIHPLNYVIFQTPDQPRSTRNLYPNIPKSYHYESSFYICFPVIDSDYLRNQRCALPQ